MENLNLIDQTNVFVLGIMAVLLVLTSLIGHMPLLMVLVAIAIAGIWEINRNAKLR